MLTSRQQAFLLHDHPFYNPCINHCSTYIFILQKSDCRYLTVLMDFIPVGKIQGDSKDKHLIVHSPIASLNLSRTNWLRRAMPRFRASSTGSQLVASCLSMALFSSWQMYSTLRISSLVFFHRAGAFVLATYPFMYQDKKTLHSVPVQSRNYYRYLHDD